MLKTTTTLRLTIAILLVIVSLAMLVKFDEIIESLFEHVATEWLAKGIPILIVTSQVFALPFLTGLKTHEYILKASKIMAMIIPVGWLLMIAVFLDIL